MSIRVRLIFMCLAVALLPAVPLSLLVQSLLEKSFNVGLSDTVEQALQSGLVISRERLDLTRTVFETQVNEIVRELSGSGADSAGVAAALASGGAAAGRIDGFIMGGPGPSASGDSAGSAKPPAAATTDSPGSPPGVELAAFSADPAYARLLNRHELVRLTAASGRPDLAFYETTAPYSLLAVWTPSTTGERTPGRHHGGAKRPVLFYEYIDPDFLAQADQLLGGRQIFAQLRLSQSELSRSFLYPFFIIYAVILGLALALAFLIAERLADPIRRLAQGTRIIAAGDWSYREKTRGGGEIGRLIDAFNAMIQRLEQQQNRLVDMEKMAAWREMARRLAHEIKNPLLPIRLTVEELRDQYRGDDPEFSRLLADSTRLVGDELASLQKLVKEFSSFARLPEMKPRPGSLSRLVEDVAGLYTQPPVAITADPATPEIPFDPDQMRQVLVNLLENSSIALRQQTDGRIRISLRPAGGQVEIEFADNGPGIPPDVLPRIFDPYFTTRREGTGLGLAMVKNIILLHGGSIEAGSPPGRGTVFHIKLPIHPAGRDEGKGLGPE